MVFGLEENEKKLQNAFLATGADMSIVKPWIKLYSKSRKAAVTVMGDYYKTRDVLSKLISELGELEQMMIGYNTLSGNERSRFSEILKDMKKMQGAFDNDFVLSKDDRDFQTTLTSVCNLGPRYLDKQTDGVILHSEIENLISLANEGIEREKPDLFALAFFYQNHKHEELNDMTFSEKSNRVMEVFQKEFIALIEAQLIYCMQQAESLNDRYEGDLNKKNARLIAEIRPLLPEGASTLSSDKRAEKLLRELCKI